MNQTLVRKTDLYDCTARQGIRDKNLMIQLLVLCSINLFPTITAIVGNAICITAIVKNPTLQTTSNMWVGALCVSDIIVGLIGQPVYYASLISIITGQKTRKIWLASTNGTILLTNTSFFIAYFVTVDRYVAICHPFMYARLATKKKCIFGAFLAIVLSIPTICVNNFAPGMIRYYIPAIMVVIVVQIIVYYCRIYATILKQRRHIASVTVNSEERVEYRRRSIEKRRAYTIGIIISFMLISYGPMSGVKILLEDTGSYYICRMSEKTIVAISWGQFFVLLNSAMNPIIYCFRMQDIRNAVRRMFAGADTVQVLDYRFSTMTNSYGGYSDPITW